MKIIKTFISVLFELKMKPKIDFLAPKGHKASKIHYILSSIENKTLVHNLPITNFGLRGRGGCRSIINMPYFGRIGTLWP